MTEEELIDQSFSRTLELARYAPHVFFGAAALHVCGVTPSPLALLVALSWLFMVITTFRYLKPLCAEIEQSYSRGEDRHSAWVYALFMTVWTAGFVVAMLLLSVVDGSRRWEFFFVSILLVPFAATVTSAPLIAKIARNPDVVWSKFAVSVCYHLGGSFGLYVGFRMFPKVENYLPYFAHVVAVEVLVERHVLGRKPKYYDSPLPVAVEPPKVVDDVPVRIRMRAGVEVKRPGKET